MFPLPSVEEKVRRKASKLWVPFAPPTASAELDLGTRCMRGRHDCRYEYEVDRSSPAKPSEAPIKCGFRIGEPQNDNRRRAQPEILQIKQSDSAVNSSAHPGVPTVATSPLLSQISCG